MKTLAQLCLITAGLTIIGCGFGPSANYSRMELLSVGGTVSLDGQPLSGAVVAFDDAADGSFSYGLTDSSGKFQLQFDSKKRGAKPGSKVVRINTSRKILGLNTDQETGDTDEAVIERIPEKYNKESVLLVDVASDKTNFIFNLKSN